MHIFIDMDGVLADFDKRAIEIVGCRPRDYENQEGEASLWEKLYSYKNFFLSLEPMYDAFDLWQGVHELGFKPTILTGIPREDGFSIHPATQKKMWAKKWFDTDRIITCKSRDKFRHITQPGDVLIDDWKKYIPLWEKAGGVFILHQSAEESLRALKAYVTQQRLI
jgi:hypothetical protein